MLLGGDGSLHAAANSSVRAELALIPAGGANNVARGASASHRLRRRRAPRRPGCRAAARRDLVKSAGQRYLAVEGVSAGFHALARPRYTGVNSTDTRAAIRAGLSAVARFEPLTVALSEDGACRLVRIGQLFVANMPLFGPGLRLAPRIPADGLLDVVTIDGGRGAIPRCSPPPPRHPPRPPGRHAHPARTVRIATAAARR